MPCISEWKQWKSFKTNVKISISTDLRLCGFLLGNNLFVSLDWFINLGVVLRSLHDGFSGHFYYFSLNQWRFANNVVKLASNQATGFTYKIPHTTKQGVWAERSYSLSTRGSDETTPVLRRSLVIETNFINKIIFNLDKIFLKILIYLINENALSKKTFLKYF